MYYEIKSLSWGGKDYLILGENIKAWWVYDNSRYIIIIIFFCKSEFIDNKINVHILNRIEIVVCQ